MFLTARVGIKAYQNNAGSSCEVKCKIRIFSNKLLVASGSLRSTPWHRGKWSKILRVPCFEVIGRDKIRNLGYFKSLIILIVNISVW